MLLLFSLVSARGAQHAAGERSSSKRARQQPCAYAQRAKRCKGAAGMRKITMNGSGSEVVSKGGCGGKGGWGSMRKVARRCQRDVSERPRRYLPPRFVRGTIPPPPLIGRRFFRHRAARRDAERRSATAMPTPQTHLPYARSMFICHAATMPRQPFVNVFATAQQNMPSLPEKRLSRRFTAIRHPRQSLIQPLRGKRTTPYAAPRHA